MIVVIDIAEPIRLPIIAVGDFEVDRDDDPLLKVVLMPVHTYTCDHFKVADKRPPPARFANRFNCWQVARGGGCRYLRQLIVPLYIRAHSSETGLRHVLAPIDGQHLAGNRSG